MEKVVTSHKVLVCGDFDGHVGSDMGGFGGVYEGLRIMQINDGGVRLLYQAVGKGLLLINTCFQKIKSWLIILIQCETETMTDYIVVNKKYRSTVKDVIVISGKEIVIHHCLHGRSLNYGSWESQK